MIEIPATLGFSSPILIQDSIQLSDEIKYLTELYTKIRSINERQPRLTLPKSNFGSHRLRVITDFHFPQSRQEMEFAVMAPPIAEVLLSFDRLTQVSQKRY